MNWLAINKKPIAAILKPLKQKSIETAEDEEPAGRPAGWEFFNKAAETIKVPIEKAPHCEPSAKEIERIKQSQPVKPSADKWTRFELIKGKKRLFWEIQLTLGYYKYIIYHFGKIGNKKINYASTKSKRVGDLIAIYHGAINSILAKDYRPAVASTFEVMFSDLNHEREDHIFVKVDFSNLNIKGLLVTNLDYLPPGKKDSAERSRKSSTKSFDNYSQLKSWYLEFVRDLVSKCYQDRIGRTDSNAIVSDPCRVLSEDIRTPVMAAPISQDTKWSDATRVESDSRVLGVIKNHSSYKFSNTLKVVLHSWESGVLFGG